MNFEKIIVFIFYLILIGVIATSLNKVLNSSTAFEEYEISNDTKLPSFTLCPNKNENGDSIETFEETMIAIEKTKKNYAIKMSWSRPFDKGLVSNILIHTTRIVFSNHFDRYDLDLSDPNILRKHFNVTLEDVWYFAPRILDFNSYSTVICLIWTSPFTGPLTNFWTNKVS